MDFSKQLMDDYQREANKKLASVCRYLIVLFILMLVCGYAGVFNMPDIAYVGIYASIGVMFLPTILYNWCKFHSNFIRYFMLALLVIMSGMLYSILSYHVIIMTILPVVIASVYRQRKCVIFTMCIGIPVLVISHYVAFHMGTYPEVRIDTALDVLTKAITPRTIEYIAIVWVAIVITDCFNDLVKKISETNNQMYMDQESLISALATMIEMQSQETGQHVQRVAEYTKILCKALGYSDTDTWKIGTAAMMHDVGKIMVPREVLEKPGKLSDEEFIAIKRHIFYGKEILEKYSGEIMELSARIAYQHHEHWDGSGYMGLKGEEICREAQCVALADFFDALVSKRVYKDAWSPEKARSEILAHKGEYFEPYLVNLFDIHFVDFLDVYRKYPD